jgi:alpha-tubulin suppressor-like RCC1 family protein
VKRSALALLVACGSPQTTTSTVPIPLASSSSASAPPPHVAIDQRRSPTISLLAYYQACILAHGKLRCRNSMTPDVPFSNEPVIAGLETVDVKQASLGRDFGCAVVPNATALCWGGNHFGQLGANVRDPDHAAPIGVVNLRGVKNVFAGPEHVCAVVDGGRVACWGKNQFGETGSTTQYLEAARELVEPQIVPGVDDVVDMALGWDATYAVQSTGAVIAWGRKKLKDDPATPQWTEQPRVIPSLEGTTSLTSNEETFCGVQKDALICWGKTYSFTKQLGQNNEIVTLPVAHARHVKLSGLHGCAIDASGSVWCFGLNNEGQLGVPPPSSSSAKYTASPPVKVPGVARAVDVVCMSSMSCALTASDEVYCWGRFDYSKQEDAHPPTRIAL